MRFATRIAAPLLAAVAFAVPATMPAAQAAHVPAPTVVHTPVNVLTPGPGANLTAVNVSALGVLNLYNAAFYQSYTLTKPGSSPIAFVREGTSLTEIRFGEIAVPQSMPTTTGVWTITSSSGASLTNVALVVVV